MGANNDMCKAGEGSVAIVGFGPAGMNCAIALRNAGYGGEVHVFSDIAGLPYSPILTSYYAAGQKEFEECLPWAEEEISSLDLAIHDNASVKHIDVEGRIIQTDEGEFGYSKCLISTGARPVANGFPKDCGYGPMMLRTMADADRMRRAFSDEGCRNVLVSGASMVALKILEAAISNGKNVTLVGMADHILDFNALPEIAARFEKGLIDRGVDLRLGRVISSVEVVDDPAAYQGRLLRVEFSSGDYGVYDEICVAHGMACNLDFLDEGALECGPGILVDDEMRSSNENIFAAGDVAQALELVSGERKLVGIWKNAVRQGAVAGEAIARDLECGDDTVPAPYKGSISSNTIGVDGLLFISGGSINLDGEKTVEIDEGEDISIARILDPSRRLSDGGAALVGFNIACDCDNAGGKAYDIGAMLSMHIEKDCAR